MSNQENEEHALRLVTAAYTGEPCRICGMEIDVAAVSGGAIFAGYSKCNEARVAHRACWDARETLTWAYP